MAVTKQDIQRVIDKLGDGDYTSYFFLPDFDKPSGGVKLAYDHVKAMNENGFKAKIIHQKEGYQPEWLKDYYEQDEDGKFINIPVIGLDEGKLPVLIEDFFFIPEGFPNVMENLAKQNAPCKRIVFCQNWYYVLNALPAGVFWSDYGITDCMSVSKSQTEYLNMIMPGLNIRNVVGHIPSDVFYPPDSMSEKKLQIAYIPSRDGGTKSHNVIKTFYAMHPYFRFIKFIELKGLSKDDYARALRESALYVNFDEYSSWGTAPIEAFMSKTLVAGWDGVGGREYMNTDNMWIVPNGDILRLALAIGNMVEKYIMDDIDEKTYSAMEEAASMYTKEAERDSIISVHSDWRDQRIEEFNQLISRIPDEATTKESE